MYVLTRYRSSGFLNPPSHNVFLSTAPLFTWYPVYKVCPICLSDISNTNEIVLSRSTANTQIPLARFHKFPPSFSLKLSDLSIAKASQESFSTVYSHTAKHEEEFSSGSLHSHFQTRLPKGSFRDRDIFLLYHLAFQNSQSTDWYDDGRWPRPRRTWSNWK